MGVISKKFLYVKGNSYFYLFVSWYNEKCRKFKRFYVEKDCIVKKNN